MKDYLLYINKEIESAKFYNMQDEEVKIEDLLKNDKYIFVSNNVNIKYNFILYPKLFLANK